MQARPNNVQTAVEALYDLTSNQIVRANMGPGLAAKWFPFRATLFFFIWFSNLIGYIPLSRRSRSCAAGSSSSTNGVEALLRAV